MDTPYLRSQTSHQQVGSAGGSRHSGTQPCLCPAPHGDTARATSAQSWLHSSVPWLTQCTRRADISQWQRVELRNIHRLNLASKCQTPSQPRDAQGKLRPSWIDHHDNQRDDNQRDLFPLQAQRRDLSTVILPTGKY